jgi:hypothetical protein
MTVIEYFWLAGGTLVFVQTPSGPSRDWGKRIIEPMSTAITLAGKLSLIRAFVTLEAQASASYSIWSWGFGVKSTTLRA